MRPLTGDPGSQFRAWMAGEVERVAKRLVAASQAPVAVQQAAAPVSDGYRTLNFQGPGVTVSADPSARRTTITIPGGYVTTATTTVVAAAGNAKVVFSSGSEPSGWQSLGFNDSAWTASLSSGSAYVSAGWGTPSGAAWVTQNTGTSLASGYKFLLRHTFTTGAGTVSSVGIQANVDNIGDYYLDGTLIGSIPDTAGITTPPLQTFAVSPGVLASGTTHVLAVRVQNTLGSSPPPQGVGTVYRVDLTVNASATATFHGAHVFNSAAQSVPSGTVTALAFDSERWDTDGYHSTSSSTSRITIPTGFGGFYSLKGCIEWAGGTGGLRDLYIRLNGSTFLSTSRDNAPNANTSLLNVTCDFALADADYVELCGYQTRGSATNVNSSSSYSPEFSAVLLG